jgi:hypothetical protein
VAATPEAARLAVEAKNQRSSIDYFQCHPEVLRDLKVRRLLSGMFSVRGFTENVSYLEALRGSGIDFIVDFPEPPYPNFRSYSDMTPLGAALGSAGVINGWTCDSTANLGDVNPIHWILTHSRSGSLSNYPELADELVETCVRGAYAGPMPEGWSRDMNVIAELRRAALSVEAGDYMAFRQAFLRWLEVQWQPPDGIEALTFGIYPIATLQFPLRFAPGKAGPLAELCRAVAPQDVTKRSELQRRVASEFVARWGKELDSAIDRCVKDLRQPPHPEVSRGPFVFAASCESRRLGVLRASKLDLERLVNRTPPP